MFKVSSYQFTNNQYMYLAFSTQVAIQVKPEFQIENEGGA